MNHNNNPQQPDDHDDNDTTTSSAHPQQHGNDHGVGQHEYHDDRDNHRLGHSRTATTPLDCPIPTKRPRLDSHDSSPQSPLTYRSLERNSSNDELSPTATAARMFPSPTHRAPGMIVLETHFHREHNNMLQDNNNTTDDNSSCGWSLKPLAPSTTTTTATVPFISTTDGSISSNSGFQQGSNAADRWRTTAGTMSSFSSTLTERSTANECDSEGTGTLDYNESKNKRKSKPQQQQQQQETVDQLTTRLDHWCSITNMRALKRRNNIYADDRHKSANYNPHEEYDYSHYQLSRHIRKLQCQNAKQEVMRALRNSSGGIQSMDDSIGSDLFGDENNYPNSSSSPPGTPPQQQLGNTTTIGTAFKGEAPPTPVASNTTKCGTNNNNTAMDVIMGES